MTGFLYLAKAWTQRKRKNNKKENFTYLNRKCAYAAKNAVICAFLLKISGENVQIGTKTGLMLVYCQQITMINIIISVN